MPEVSKRLFAVLQVRDTEIRMAVLVAAFFACIQAGLGIGANTADALFFLRFGVNYLPYVFIALGAVTFLVSLLYTASLGRFSPGRYLPVLLLIAVGLLIAERVSIFSGSALFYPVLWLTINTISLILGTLVWNVAGRVCDTRQAKRLYSLFASAGILGGVVGNSLTGPLAAWFGIENLLFLYAAVLLLGLLFLRKIVHLFKPTSKRADHESLVKDVRIGFEITLGSRLMQLIAISAILFSALFFSMSFPFSQIVSSSFGSEAQVAGFLGLFSSVVTAVTFLSSLLIANRLFTRIGIVNSVLFLPVTYLAGFVLWAVHFDLTTAVLARFAQMVVLGGIAGTAYSTFFNVIPPERRGQMLAFESGVPSQLGVMLSGVLLILGERVLNTTEIFGMGMLAAVACGYVVWRMRPAYGASLLAALRTGLVDVFSDAKGMHNLAANANARQAAVLALADPKSTVRRTAVEILASMGILDAFQPALSLLDDPEPEVRIAVLDSLGRLKAASAVARITPLLADSDASVRAAAVCALLVTDPTDLAKLEPLLLDPDARVRAQTAAALSRSAKGGQALQVLSGILHSSVSSERAYALKTVAETGAAFPAEQILPLLHDKSVAVRQAAIQALGAVEDESAKQALVQLLEDHDSDTRRAAAVALRSHRTVTDQLLLVLKTGTRQAQNAALQALVGDSNHVRGAVSDWAAAHVAQATELRSWARALGSEQDASTLAYLKDVLLEREWETEQGIVSAIGILSTPEATRLITQGVKSRDQETRAQAIEALDTLADKRLARGLVPLLEEPNTEIAPNPHAVLKTLATHPDPWLRSLSIRCLSEMLSSDWQRIAALASADSDPLVRAALPGQVPVYGENMTDTSKTLSTIDRVLFLRGVSIFSHLTPEDLQSIADLATERLILSDEFLCREGEIGQELYIIVHGKVRVLKGNNGSTRVLRNLGVGEQIGELAILCEQPRSASVMADGSDVRALVLTGDALQAILRDRPEVSRAMLSSLASRLSTL